MSPSLTEFLECFNWVDLVLVLSLIATLLIGFGLGFYRQFTLGVGLFVGLLIAGRYTGALASTTPFLAIATHVGDGAGRIAAYLTLLALPALAALASFAVFPRIFGSVVRVFDSLLGSALGVASAVLVFWLFLLGSVQAERPWVSVPVQESYLGSRLARGACVLSRIFPQEFRERVEQELAPTWEAEPPLESDATRR